MRTAPNLAASCITMRLKRIFERGRRELEDLTQMTREGKSLEGPGGGKEERKLFYTGREKSQTM